MHELDQPSNRGYSPKEGEDTYEERKEREREREFRQSAQ